MSSDEDEEEWPFDLEEATCLRAKNNTHCISYKIPFSRVLGKLTPPEKAHQRHKLGLKPPFPKYMGDKLLAMEAQGKMKRCPRIFYFDVAEALRKPGREEQMILQAADALQNAKTQLYLAQQREKDKFSAMFK
jgi:hypothetical protein